jgi:hypothetical protein
MTKSSTPKVAARMARDVDPKTASKVRTGKAGNTHHKSAPTAAAGRPKEQNRKAAAPKIAAERRDTHRKTAPKAVAEKTRNAHRKTAPKIAPEQVRDTDPMAAAQFEALRDARVPDSMRALAERNVAQTRELYERSKNALQGVLEVWEKSFGAAGQGAVALNRTIMDIAERNINASFDLATSLAGARNLAEVLELQAAYWRKVFGELQTQAEEVRALSRKMTANVADQSKPK